MPKWNSPEHKLGRKDDITQHITESDWVRVLQQEDLEDFEREILREIKAAGAAGLASTAIRVPGGIENEFRRSFSIYQVLNGKLKRGPNPDLGLTLTPFKVRNVPWDEQRIHLVHKVPKASRRN